MINLNVSIANTRLLIRIPTTTNKKKEEKIPRRFLYATVNELRLECMLKKDWNAHPVKRSKLAKKVFFLPCTTTG